MKYLKRSLIFIFLILLSLSVSAKRFDVTVTPVKTKITSSDMAEFNVEIKNNYPGTETFKIYTLSFPNWEIRTIPLVNPITLRLKANTSDDINVYVNPIHISELGGYVVDLNVKNSRTQELIKKPIKVEIRTLDQLIGSYVPTIILNYDLPDEIDPRNPIPLKISLSNQNPLNVSNLTLKLESKLITTIFYDRLGPKEDKTIERTFEINPLTHPQEDTLFISGYIGDKQVINPVAKKFKIKGISDISKQETPTEEFLRRGKHITYTNNGNKVSEDQIRIEFSILKSLFITTKPKAIIVEENKKKYYAWNPKIEPTKEFKITIIENYRPLFFLAIVTLFAIIFYFLYRSPIVIRKTASNIEKLEGGISELKVVINIKNRGARPLKDVLIVDKIPNIADVEKELYIGTLQPIKILKHEKKGSIVKWIIDDLGSGEERVISYRIKSRLSILGDFNLPPTTAKFKMGNSQKFSKSNLLVISS